RSEDEIRREIPERGFENAPKLPGATFESTVRESRRRDLAAAEDRERGAGLGRTLFADLLPPRGVGLVAGAVGHDQDTNRSPARDRAGESTAAAEHLVVGVRGEDENAVPLKVRRFVRNQRSLVERGVLHRARRLLTAHRFYRAEGALALTPGG